MGVENIKENTTSWFNSNKLRNILLFICISLIIVLLLSVRGCNSIKTDLAISNQNNTTLADNVRYIKNKNDDLEATKNVLISEKKNLGDFNRELEAELKKEKGNVFELNKIIAGFHSPDTVYITTELLKYPEDVYGLKWDYDTTFNQYNYRTLSGISKFYLKDSTIEARGTILTNDTIGFSLVTGLKENKDNNLEIFIRSDYPGFSVTKIDGAIIDPKKNPIIKKYSKKRRFSVGPYLGIGFGSDLKVSVQVGIGVQFKLFSF